jgi:hypothetical protein
MLGNSEDLDFNISIFKISAIDIQALKSQIHSLSASLVNSTNNLQTRITTLEQQQHQQEHQHR